MNPNSIDDTKALRKLPDIPRDFYDDYTLIGEAVARDLARQKIRYVEGFFSPPDYRRSTLDPHRVTEALRAGLERIVD